MVIKISILQKCITQTEMQNKTINLVWGKHAKLFVGSVGLRNPTTCVYHFNYDEIDAESCSLIKYFILDIRLWVM